MRRRSRLHPTECCDPAAEPAESRPDVESCPDSVLPDPSPESTSAGPTLQPSTPDRAESGVDVGATRAAVPLWNEWSCRELLTVTSAILTLRAMQSSRRCRRRAKGRCRIRAPETSPIDRVFQCIGELRSWCSHNTASHQRATDTPPALRTCTSNTCTSRLCRIARDPLSLYQGPYG